MAKTNPYADQFKPALLFGIPPLSTIVSRIYLSKNLEEYDVSGSHMSEVDSDGKSTDEQLDSGFYYALETANVAVCPTVRPVSVKGKDTFKYCYLIEPTLGATGIAVVMFEESKADSTTEIFCNLRVMPYSTFTEVLSSNSGSTTPQVEIPKSDLIKLNITLAPSDTGEVLYKTKSCEVNLESITSNDTVVLEREFEFELAKFAAQICGSFLDIAPANTSDETQVYTSNYSMKMPDLSDNLLKETLLGVGLIGSASIDLTGTIAVGNITPDWRFAGLFIGEVLI